MDKAKQRVIQFLQKEIKTYTALALFLSKTDFKQHMRLGGKETLLRPTFYKERLKEAKKLVTELRKSNQDTINKSRQSQN
jgi:hypothetical protein